MIGLIPKENGYFKCTAGMFSGHPRGLLWLQDFLELVSHASHLLWGYIRKASTHRCSPETSQDASSWAPNSPPESGGMISDLRLRKGPVARVPEGMAGAGGRVRLWLGGVCLGLQGHSCPGASLPSRPRSVGNRVGWEGLPALLHRSLGLRRGSRGSSGQSSKV